MVAAVRRLHDLALVGAEPTAAAALLSRDAHVTCNRRMRRRVGAKVREDSEDFALLRRIGRGVHHHRLAARNSCKTPPRWLIHSEARCRCESSRGKLRAWKTAQRHDLITRRLSKGSWARTHVFLDVFGVHAEEPLRDLGLVATLDDHRRVDSEGSVAEVGGQVLELVAEHSCGALPKSEELHAVDASAQNDGYGSVDVLGDAEVN